MFGRPQLVNKEGTERHLSKKDVDQRPEPEVNGLALCRSTAKDSKQPEQPRHSVRQLVPTCAYGGVEWDRSRSWSRSHTLKASCVWAVLIWPFRASQRYANACSQSEDTAKRMRKGWLWCLIWPKLCSSKLVGRLVLYVAQGLWLHLLFLTDLCLDGTLRTCNSSGNKKKSRREMNSCFSLLA